MNRYVIKYGEIDELLYLWSRWTIGAWNSNVPRKPLAKTGVENIIILCQISLILYIKHVAFITGAVVYYRS